MKFDAVLFGVPSKTGRPTIVAKCQHCQWGAQITADTILEGAEFVYRRLVDHVGFLHPGLPVPPPPTEVTT